MCDDDESGYNEGMRDGNLQDRIPEDPDSETYTNYGMHENYKYWDECRTRERNNGTLTCFIQRIVQIDSKHKGGSKGNSYTSG